MRSALIGISTSHDFAGSGVDHVTVDLAFEIALEAGSLLTLDAEMLFANAIALRPNGCLGLGFLLMGFGGDGLQIALGVGAAKPERHDMVVLNLLVGTKRHAG